MERVLIRLLFALAAVLTPWFAVNTVLDLRRVAADLPVSSDINGRTFAELDRQMACMTRNVYYEAAREPAEGKIAVAQVVMNRVASHRFPNDPCEVIYQKTVLHQQVICQFSWLCDGSEHRHRINQDLWRESEIAAKRVLVEGVRLPGLEHALFYHADYVNPRWRLDRINQIGRHIFYQPKNQESI